MMMMYQIKLNVKGKTFPCRHFDGFCKSTLKHPNTSVCFPEKNSLFFQISDFVGCMFKLSNRYCLETDDFFESTGKVLKKKLKAFPVFFPGTISQLGFTTPNLKRLGGFPQKILSVKNPNS